MALQNRVSARYTNPEIARHVGVSYEMVRKMREEMAPPQSATVVDCPAPSPNDAESKQKPTGSVQEHQPPVRVDERREGADGKMYPALKRTFATCPFPPTRRAGPSIR